MKVVEVNVLMYKNVLLTDVGTVVVRYSGTGHDNWWSFGLCAKEEREVIELLEVMETRRR